MQKKLSRRQFIKGLGAAAASTVPMGLVNVAFGEKKGEDFTFAYISDPHITHISGTKFVNNFDKGLQKAVNDVNFMFDPPDFVVFGGDLAQLGKREELDHGMEILSKLEAKVRFVIGEHDYYLDLGKYWEEKISPLYYSFDHKGVHFVVLNSILTHDQWTLERWPTPMDRMKQMARLDNPDGSPFMVRAAQRKWLAEDLAKVDKKTPLIVLSHSPLYKIFKNWNFWTDDAEEVQALLRPFEKVTVLHGHVHQILYNQIGNISFQAMMATAWPWPYPVSYTQAKNAVPSMTVFMNRADPFHERDATGWSAITVSKGRVSNNFELWKNTPRSVTYDPAAGHPSDTKYQDPATRISPQNHY